ncbi:MAG: histidinol-phosphate transaminase [Gammaproteobacteria bacterium]|jgi:histidinol-phosphate aminotransferase|nr:histidinol-phosphate transaminase [Chromatiales bacterium]MDP6675388.1 histidinol-phosphate transaminase [Gammaproteobacteria bacterium]
MSNAKDLARPEIRNLRPYRPAQYKDDLLRLNANETPWRPAGDNSADGLNYYPEVRPFRLLETLAMHYGIDPGQVLVTRGSSDAIDLLIRCFCRPAEDDILICPPTFGMYEVYAQLQGAGIIQVPLDAQQGYTLDLAGIEAALSPRTKLLFVCSPNNPTGNRISTGQIDSACRAIKGNGLVVVDAAYIEFSSSDPTRELLDRYDNIVILRTLSKAFGLAGIRCGAVLASPEIIDLVGCILPPYVYPTPCADAALAGLGAGEELNQRIATLCRERQRVSEALVNLPGVEQVLPSEANFVLVRASAPARLVAAAKEGGILIRDFSWDPFTPGCLRITIGAPAQNDQLLKALAGQRNEAES